VLAQFPALEKDVEDGEEAGEAAADSHLGPQTAEAFKQAPEEEEDMHPSNKPALEATSTGPEVRGAVAAPEAKAAAGSSEAAADIRSMTNCIY
jgi:hypothetical protein